MSIVMTLLPSLEGITYICTLIYIYYHVSQRYTILCLDFVLSSIKGNVPTKGQSTLTKLFHKNVLRRNYTLASIKLNLCMFKL